MSLTPMSTSTSQPFVPAPTSPPLSPTPLPQNPYNTYSTDRRDLIHRRDNPRLPTAVDRWLQANLSEWPKADPRLVTTSMLNEEVVFTVVMEHTPVRAALIPYFGNIVDVSNNVGYSFIGS